MTGWATHWRRRGNSRQRKLRAFALAGTSALVLMLATGEARAEPVDWIGDALKEDPVTGVDVPDDDWNNPDNWTPKRVPTADDEVTVSVNGEPAGVMLDGGSASAGSLMVRGFTTAGAALTIRNGGSLTVGGGFGLIDLRSNLVIGNSIFGTGGIAPGDVNTALVDIASTGALIFDHNDTSGLYTFASGITGEGRVDVLSGWTVLTGFNDYTGGTEINALATLRGDSESLFGGIAGEAFNFGGTIFASTLIIGGGGNVPLEIVAGGGVINLQAGDYVLAAGTDIGGDRLHVDNANVTVGADAMFGAGGGGFPANATLQGGLELGTHLVDSTVTFEPGSTVFFLSDIRLVGESTLVLNSGPASDNAVVSRLSGDFDSTLDIGADTRLDIFSNMSSGGAGSFAGSLNGHGDIFKSGGGTWTLLAGDESTFDGNIEVWRTTPSATAPDLIAIAELPQASLSIREDTTAFVSRTIGSLTVAGNLGIHEDETPGRLDVTGNMVMDPLAVLTMNMGAPGSVPGVGSDLITVGGDLSLDGVLLVKDAGGFDFGLYRLLTYGGALSDGSLEVVGFPAGFSAFDFNVSTSTAGQVNLLVGDVDEGDGDPPEIAMFPADADTWHEDDFDPATTVIFAGEGRPIMVSGEVERDDGGIQFADDGFELVPVAGADGIIYLPGTDIPIHVGNGTAASADFTGTIGVDLTGLGGITKTGFGTLNLTGNNSYTGGTTVQGGTLQGTTASLTGIIDFGSIEIEQRILSTTVIFTGGSSQPLNIEALGGNYQLVDGVFEVPLDVPVVPDRLVIFDSTVTVGNGATFGTRPSVFAPGTTFVDGGLAGTELVDSTVNYAAGSTLSALGDWSLHGDSALTLGIESSAALRNVSLEPGSTFEVTKDTTVEIESLTGEAGSRVIVAEGGAIAINGDSILDEIEGEDGTLKVAAALTMAGNSPDYTGTIEVLEGGTLNFSSDQNGGFGGRVMGAGNVVKDGAGTLDLFFGFDPAFSGGVSVAAGNLRGDSGGLNGDFDILAGGTLTFHQAQDGVFGGTISGAGNVVKEGDGTLELLFGFNPAFSGGVTVEAGILESTAASLLGDVEIQDSALLRMFVEGIDEIFAGTVTGTGTFAVEGGGSLTLETSSAWSRALMLEVGDGDVRVVSEEPGGTAGFGGSTVAGGSVLTVGSDTTVEVGILNGAPGSKVSLEVRSALVVEGDSILDEIDGDGLLDVRGDVTLAGDSPGFFGGIDVAPGGKLTLDGTAGNSELGEKQRLQIRALFATLNGPGGEFAGLGQWLGDVLVDSSGAVSPGNSIGTLTVDSITFEAGSILNVEVDDAGNSDLLAVTGAATLNGGTVRVQAENGTDDGSTYAPETQYTVLTAGGGVTGSFDAVSEDFAFLSAALAHGANAVTLTLTRDGLADFCLAGASANQCATGEGVESLGAGALYSAVLVLSEPGALDAFDALSGEIHASAMTTLLEDSRFVRDAAVAGLRGSFDAVGGAADGAGRRVSERSSLWGEGFGSWGNRDGDGNAVGLDRSIGGFTMGGDTLAGDNVRLGLFGGYSHASFDADGRASSGSADSLHLGVYGGGQWDGFGLRLGGAYGWHEIEVDRSVAFTGFSDGLSADYDARTLQGFAEAGYRLAAGAVALEPFASLAHVSVRSGSFSETGGAAALTAVRQTVDTSFTTLGVRAETSPGSSGTGFRLSGMAGWRHAFGDDPARIHQFASGGGGFAVAGAPLADDVAVLEAGVDVVLAPGATIGLGYSGQYGSGFTDQGAKARLAVRF